MKTLTTSALIATIGATLLSLSANAGNSPTTYAPDDLFLGFRQTAGPGATQDYLLDLGQISNYNLNQSFTLLSSGTTGYGSVGSTYPASSVRIGTPLSIQTPGKPLFYTAWKQQRRLRRVGSDPAKTLYTTNLNATSLSAKLLAVRIRRRTTSTSMGNNGYSGNKSTANSDLRSPASDDSGLLCHLSARRRECGEQIVRVFQPLQ